MSEQELRTIDKGDVVTRSEAIQNEAGKSAGRGWAAIAIDKPLAEVWTTMARLEDRAQYVPRLKKVEVLERQGDPKGERVRVKQEIDATITTARYTAWYHIDPTDHSIQWSLDKSASDNTVKAVDGDYRVAELAPGRTLLVYRTYVDTGLHVPFGIQSYMQRRSLPDLLRAFKKRIESGGTWKK